MKNKKLYKRENESDESKYPFTDLIVDYMNRDYDVCDFWPALRSISESAFYDEVYKDLEENISEELLAQHYNEVMKNAYIGGKLDDIIPCMGIFEFLDKLKINSKEVEE